MLTMLLGADPLSHVVQHTQWDLNPGGGLYSFPIISNHIIMQVVAALLLVWIIPKALQMRAGGDAVGKLVPRGFGNAVEGIAVGLRDAVFLPNLGKYADIFAPYLWSLFFFILTCNLLGMIPLPDWTGFVGGGHLIGGTSTCNIFVTGTLAVVTFVLVVYNGLKYHGMNYVKHFFIGPPGINVFIALLEVVGLFFKHMALCVRLFANMLAGHTILAVLLGFIPTAIASMNAFGAAGVTVVVIVSCIAFNFLELLVAFLHAFIFTMLTAVFLGQAVNIHHDDHEGDAHGHGHAAH
ncbi:MAG: F0F1 ATP synthase subunit A [Phycisphaerae bacterium]